MTGGNLNTIYLNTRVIGRKTAMILRRCLNVFTQILKLFVKRRTNFSPLKKEEYLLLFGVEIDNDIVIVKNKKLLNKAYDKAWENRNYEIDKFWTRAAYFWGFIVLIFGAYLSILSSDNKNLVAMRLDLYLILLGFLFSISWYLVILGSKCWQRNWESHIDYLEDFVSGPIYKTIFYSGKRFYSVSKLNEMMAVVVMVVWSILCYHYINNNLVFTSDFTKIEIVPTVAIILTILCAVSLRFGYALGDYKTEPDNFINRWEF